jgi:chromatin assembly factor 1 subunit B
MRVSVIEISWHCQEPVFSVDFHPFAPKLVTAGQDKLVKIWNYDLEELRRNRFGHLSRTSKQNNDGMVSEKSNVGKFDLFWKSGAFAVKYCASLKNHSAPVNCAKFSPDGQFVASGGDDGFLIVWKYSPVLLSFFL